MKQKKVLVLIVIVFLNSMSIYAQEDCLGLLKGMLKKMSVRDGNTSCFIDYQVRSKPSRKGMPESTLRVKMKADDDQVEVISSEVEAYQDKQYSFMVIPSRKAIYWGDSQLNNTDSSDRNELLQLQTKALERCTIKSCKEVNSNSNYDKEIILAPDEKIRTGSGIKSISYFINTKKNTLYKTLFTYSKGKLEYAELTFFSIEYGKSMRSYPVKSKFLTAQGKLLSKYAGYGLVDVRAKRK